MNRLFAAFLVSGLFLSGTQGVIAADLDHLLQDYLDESQLTGISIAIDDGEQIETASVGYLDTDRVTPVDASTRFYVASSGKSVVAAAILAYVADGRLSLDEPVLPLVDDLPGISRLANIDKATLRQLLNHTSGLVDYLDDHFVALSLEAGAEGMTIEQALTEAIDEPASFSPGEGFDYSNTNYLLLGHVLEGLEGSLSAALEQKVFLPAKMSATSVGIGRTSANAAHGRDSSGADYSAVAWASTFGDGPLVSTPSDLVRFARALFHDMTIIPADLVDEMTTGSDVEPTYGLGMGIETDDWGQWYGHTGGFDGFEADFRHYPEQDVTLAYAANGTSDSQDNLLELVAE